MSIATNVGGVWKEGTPDKVNVGGAWKTITVAKANVGGVWKDVYPTEVAEVEPPYITEIRYKPTGNPYELELTAWGGVGPEFDWKMAPFETVYTRGPKVVTKVFPTHGDFDAYCVDRSVGYSIDNRVTVEKPASIPPYLYKVDIVYKGNRVVDFTAISGFVHTDPTEEAYMFRCAEFSSLNGYVSKNFTKTFPSSGYSKFNCTLQDVSGDILLADAKTISFTVDNK